ncbi:MAG TPA: right-handed parallel beta-helix repeat-containing protein [Candidatus Limnocylindrales bacterium]|nr:right-handed parallel beta-helix repeat-containing protein [Candidatus Limnocylindrales bacterium]
MRRLPRAIAAAAACACVLAAAPSSGETLRVTSAADSGAGSLRAAIEEANLAEEPATISIAIDAADAIIVESALPEITADGTVIDGGGATIREGPGCVRPGGKAGCDGLAITAAHVTVRNLTAAGFTFDGVSVRGAKANHVTIRDVVALDNLDDGVGVSAAAGPVLVDRCLLMGNGFRTKGKGLLVFDHAEATLRDSVVVANRDGVTVTKNSHVRLERSIIAGSFDKGLGAGDARITGTGNLIVANGTGEEFAEKVPNGDGLRLSLAAKAVLTDTHIDANGDSGVVAIDGSMAELRGGSVASNGGFGIVASGDANVQVSGVVVEDNAKGAVSTRQGGRTNLRPPR